MKLKIGHILSAIGAAISALFLFVIAISPAHAAYPIVWSGRFFTAMTQIEISLETSLIIALLLCAVYFIPAALFGACLWLAVRSHRHARKIALTGSAFITLTCSILSAVIRNVSFGMFAQIFASIALGSFCCVGCVWIYECLQKKLPAVFNRETISYIVFGVLTTVVSFVSQMLFSAAGFPVIVNTIGSWVCAVLFAYIVNKLFVFESKTDTAKAFWRELGLFIGARVASLGMELVFMFVTVELLHFSEAVCKLIAQVFILVANYVFSKLVIFKKK